MLGIVLPSTLANRPDLMPLFESDSNDRSGETPGRGGTASCRTLSRTRYKPTLSSAIGEKRPNFPCKNA